LVSVGEVIKFHIDPARLRFFDPETTEAIGFEIAISRLSAVPNRGPVDAASAETRPTTATSGDGA
jgi:hypothetical protein